MLDLTVCQRVWEKEPSPKRQNEMKQIKETYEINKNGLLGTDVHRDAERRKAPFAAID